MPNRTAPSDLSENYLQLHAAQAASGLSIPEFAEEIGRLVAASYADESKTPHAPGFRGAAQVLEVIVSDSERSTSSSAVSTLTFTVDDRFRVDLPVDFEAAAVGRLLELLDRC